MPFRHVFHVSHSHETSKPAWLLSARPRTAHPPVSVPATFPSVAPLVHADMTFHSNSPVCSFFGCQRWYHKRRLNIPHRKNLTRDGLAAHIPAQIYAVTYAHSFPRILSTCRWSPHPSAATTASTNDFVRVSSPAGGNLANHHQPATMPTSARTRYEVSACGPSWLSSTAAAQRTAP